MKKISILVLLLIMGFASKAQIGLTFRDTLICRGKTITMGASLTGVFGGLNQDDIFGQTPIDIGFPFVYFGNTYTRCLLSPNGFITFDTSFAGQTSQWVYATALANGQLNKSILFGFMDTDFQASAGNGTIKYQTWGTPGNRKFVVEFCNVPKFGTACNQYKVTNQVILYEGSNIIEMHTKSMPGTPTCPSVTQGEAVQGIRYQSPPNTYEFFTPGRQPVPSGGTWGSVGCTNSSYRYTPTSNTSYTITNITFNPWQIIENLYSYLLKWYDANGNYLGQGANMTVTPTNPPQPATGTYYVVNYTGNAGCDTSVPHTFTDTVRIRYDDRHVYINAEMCAGSTYNFNGKTLYSPGVYNDTFRSASLGCDSIITLTLGVNPKPNVTINETNVAKICQGDAHLFRAVKNANYTYQWLLNGAPVPGATSDTFLASIAGYYRVKITTNKGCIDTSKTVQLIINPNPTVKINYVSKNDFCAMDTVTLRAATTGNNLEYIWSPDAYFRETTTSQYNQVKAIVPQSGYIKVKVFNGDLCSASDSVMIRVHPCCEIGMPNAFSPNSDNKNDYFLPVLQVGQKIVTFQVYNRRGQLVYNNDNPIKGWDGRDKDGNKVGLDVYMYRIEYMCSDGKLYKKSGDVTILN